MTQSGIVVRTLILWTLAAAGLFAQGALPQTTGSISGRVLDADSYEPVVGAKVGSRATGYAVTDSAGRYALQNITPGHVRFGVQEENGGYLAMSLNAAQEVTVGQGAALMNVDFRVRLDARISGRVLDENGEPVSRMRVAIVSREYSRDRGVNSENEYSSGELWYSQGGRVTTDDRGRYEITDLWAGRKYWILVYDAKMNVNPISDAPADPQSRKRVPVATYFPSAPTLETAAPVILHSLEHRDNVDIRMASAPSYCVEGATTVAGVPSPLRFGLIDENTYAPLSATIGQSGTDGRVRVCGLYPGRYKLTAMTAPHLPNLSLSDYSGAVPVTIKDDDVKDVRVDAEPLLTIPGNVVWDDTSIDRLPPPLISVATTPLSGGMTLWSRTNIPGDFSLQAMPNIHYSLQIRLSTNFYVKDITYGGSSILDKSFVPADGNDGLRLTIARNGGVVSARVAAADGQPAAKASVFVLSANAHTETEFLAGMISGRTDEKGSYTSPILAPGKYVVLATSDPPPGVILEPQETFYLEKTPETLSLLMRARSQGQAVDVGPGATVQVNLSPKPLQ